MGFVFAKDDLQQGCHQSNLSANKNFSVQAGFHWRRSRSRKSASDLVKIENQSRKRSHKLDEIGVRRIKTVPFSSDSAYDSDAYDPGEKKIVGVANRSVGFILRLPLTTPTI